MARRALIGLVALSAAARAEAPLPDWREEVIVGVWTALDDQLTQACAWPLGRQMPPANCDTTRIDQTIAQATAFVEQVVDDGRIRYIIGLGHRYAGRTRRAADELQRAAVRAPDRPEIWSDLSEVLLTLGDYPAAAEAARKLITLRPSGNGAWYGWLQLAQALAWQHDADGLERALSEAFRLGLPGDLLAGNTAWRSFVQDPALSPVLLRLLPLHVSPSTMQSLQ